MSVALELLSERVLCRLCEPVLVARGLREPLAGHKACSSSAGVWLLLVCQSASPQNILAFPRSSWIAARMTFFFSDHPFIGLGLVALVLGHAVALAWWVKQAMKPMARGSGDPWLLQKNK